jgi:hypothetical protein
MTHPFQSWPGKRRRLALALVICAAILPLALSSATTPLAENEPGGRTIIDFELAGSVDETEEILATWRAAGVIDEAKRIQLFDLVFPLIYCSALAGACVAAAAAWSRAGRPSLARAGIAMAWVAFAAAVFDYVENAGLAVSLWGDPASPWPQIAWVAAILKFTASGLALAYALTGGAAWLAARRSAPRASEAGPG